MTLRWRFALAFGATALVPIAVAAILVWRVEAASARAAAADRLEVAGRDAERELAALGEATARATASLADVDNPVVGGLLLELEKSGGVLRGAERRVVERGAATAARGLGLDVLLLCDGDGTVLAAPHHVGRVGERDARPARLEKSGAVAAWERTLSGGRPATVLVLAAAASVGERGARVEVLGGRLAAGLVDRLAGPGVAARLVAADGRVLRASPGFAAGGRRSLALRDERGAALATLEVSVPDPDLRGQLTVLAAATAGAALAAALLAMLLGFLVARRITRGLDALVVGVGAVSRGDLSHHVRLSGGDEVAALARAFNAMTAELESSKERLLAAERVAAWQDIARRLAHEIKNPLTPIRMSMETLRKARDAGHASFAEIFDESTATVLEEVARLGRIVSEFSQFARLPRPDRRPLQLNEVVASAIALYHGAVRVTSELADGLPPILADRDQLTQVVLNLLENARDAIALRGSEQSVGRIAVATRLAGARVELSVEDNGPGFDPAVGDQLFLPYYTTKAGGTGLGLAIAARIVAEHDGRITATSTPGKGARFLVELPAGGAPPPAGSAT